MTTTEKQAGTLRSGPRKQGLRRLQPCPYSTAPAASVLFFSGKLTHRSGGTEASSSHNFPSTLNPSIGFIKLHTREEP